MSQNPAAAALDLSKHTPMMAQYMAIKAEHPGTLVFYMGVTTAARWTAALILAGKSPATPAAIVRRCSWPDQETIRCTLGTVPDEIQRRRLRPPRSVKGEQLPSRQGNDRTDHENPQGPVGDPDLRTGRPGVACPTFANALKLSVSDLRKI